jgi:hypothetical protein
LKTFGLALWEKLKSANVDDFIRLKSSPLSSLGLGNETIDSGVAGFRQTSILATMSEDAYVRDLPMSATPEGLLSIPTGRGGSQFQSRPRRCGEDS